MSSSVNYPHFKHRSAARVEVTGSTIGVPPFHVSALGHRPQFSKSVRPRLFDDLMTVSGMHRRVFVAMKDNGRDKSSASVEYGRLR